MDIRNKQDQLSIEKAEAVIEYAVWDLASSKMN